MDRHSAYFLATAAIILILTSGVFLYAKGYAFDNRSKTLEKTGMIAIKSQPEGAQVFLDGKDKKNAPTNLAGLKGGIYILRVEKPGYSSFQKEIPVQEEFVTEIEAILVPLNPELKPLTTFGVKSPVPSANGDKIYFLEPGSGKPGLWALSLSGNVFSLIRGNLDLLAADSPKFPLSLGAKLELSANGEEALISQNKTSAWILNLSQTSPLPQATSSIQLTKNNWLALDRQGKIDRAQKRKVNPTRRLSAIAPETLWSPDGKRFLFVEARGDKWEYRLFDTSDPLAIGEKPENLVLALPKTAKIQVVWYADSKHLIATECEQENPQEECLTGSIRLIRTDGTNNTLIYSGALSSTQVFPTPDGTKIVFLTRFNANNPANLYAIILR